jgi:predicted RNase H-like nuclease (RuvC/YqgF family)
VSDVQAIHMSITAAIGVAFTIGAPLLGYIVRAKDRELRKLWEKHERVCSEIEAREKAAANETTQLRDHCHQLELRVTEMRAEVQTANRIGEKVDRLGERIDHMAQEVAGLKGALRGTSRSSSSLPRVLSSDPPTPRRG